LSWQVFNKPAAARTLIFDKRKLTKGVLNVKACGLGLWGLRFVWSFDELFALTEEIPISRNKHNFSFLKILLDKF